MIIRNETPADHAAIDRVNRAAFGGPYEAELIERLRHDGLMAISLVAVVKDEIVGHILMSWLQTTIDGRAIDAVALAPMAVAPRLQNQGVGSKLVAAAIEAARAIDVAAIIVLGHPEFYPRFGFSTRVAEKLDTPFPGDAFMALELKPGALAGSRGKVTYPDAFGVGEGL
jgi:putative acetyltransferase